MCALVQVLDYGSGNLFSIKDGLDRILPDLKVKISSRYKSGKSDGIVLPGVGSFTSAQKILGLNKKAIIQDVKEGMPLLGICLGMQLLFEKSEEGSGLGLSIFRGNVVRFKPERGLKVPHMGWNTVNLVSENSSSICKNLSKKEWAYFVHSYYPVPKDKSTVRAITKYGRQEFPSIIEDGNIFATQFHPEKSSKAGLKLIKNFAAQVSKYSKK